MQDPCLTFILYHFLRPRPWRDVPSSTDVQHWIPILWQWKTSHNMRKYHALLRIFLKHHIWQAFYNITLNYFFLSKMWENGMLYNSGTILKFSLLFLNWTAFNKVNIQTNMVFPKQDDCLPWYLLWIVLYCIMCRTIFNHSFIAKQFQTKGKQYNLDWLRRLCCVVSHLVLISSNLLYASWSEISLDSVYLKVVTW